jgi:putative aminopeptidase
LIIKEGVIMQATAILKELTGLTSPSGHEESMIRYMKAWFEKLNGSAEVDKMGNVFTVIEGSDESPEKIMVFAHMDEVGLIVEKIDSNGFIRFNRMGGIPVKVLPGTWVVLNGKNGPVEGVVGIKAHHYTTDKEKNEVNGLEQLYIDIGTKTKEEVLKLGIDVGTCATYQPHYQLFPNGRVASKTLDNRGGCLSLILLLDELIKAKLSKTITIAATVLEEFNLQGVIPLANALDLDAAICLDIAVSCDTPDLSWRNDITLGMGPTINEFSFHGRGSLAGLIPNQRFKETIIEIAKANNIKLQRNIFMGGLTDASYFHMVHEGVPAIDLGFPVRYTHSPVEVCEINDILELVRLLKVMLTREERFDFSRV